MLGLSAACDDNTGALGGTGGGGAGGSGGKLSGVDAGAPTAAQKAEAQYRALEPDLVKACGGSCHGTGVSGGNPPTWLAAPDTYVSIKAFPGAIVADPNTSRLLLKGPHAGPALTTGTYKALGDRVLTWLTAESLALSLQHLPETDPFTVTMGANSVEITKGETDTDGGTKLAGAKLTFTAAKSGSILTITKLTLVAPASTGVRIAHPIFNVVPPSGPSKKDPVDTFSNLDMGVPAGQSAPLGTGDLFLFDWTDANKLQIAFTVLEAANVKADAGAAGGCKSVATFTSSAAPAMTKDNCLSCHAGGNGGATAALDLSQMNKNDTMACAQALNKVNLANKGQSPIIQAPAGNLTHQGGKVGDTAAFTQALTTWLNNE
jgi:hypothetical protein